MRNVLPITIGSNLELLGDPPDGVVGVAYSFQFGALGGVSPYVFQSTSLGTSGLALSSSGLLSGTPTFGGDYTFTVTLTDSTRSGAVFRVFTVHIDGAGQLMDTQDNYDMVTQDNILMVCQ